MRIWLALAVLAITAGGIALDARAYTCTTSCYGSGSYRTCNTNCF